MQLRNRATPINAILSIMRVQLTIQIMTVIIEMIKRHLVNMEIAFCKAPLCSLASELVVKRRGGGCAAKK